MTTLTAKISGKNQITLPAELRRALDLQPHDRVRFELNDGEIRVTKAEKPRTFLDMMGILPPPRNGDDPDFEKAIMEAQEDRADEIVRRLEGR